MVTGSEGWEDASWTGWPGPRTTGVLVIDDCAITRKLLQVRLSRYGYEIGCYASVFEPIPWLEHGASFDVILMDIVLPELDGLTAIKLIRSLPAAVSEIPIIAISADDKADHAKDCLAAGANGFFFEAL